MALLIIHRGFRFGGIETFYLRLARYRKKNNFKTYFLIFSDRKKCDLDLVQNLEDVSNVFYKKDISKNNFSKIFNYSNLNIGKIKYFFSEINHIHTSNGETAVVGIDIIKILNQKIKLTVGFYSSREFTWGNYKELPYFEKVHRNLVLKHISKKNLYLYSEGMNDFYEKQTGIKFKGAQTFRIGVIDKYNSSDIRIKNLRSKKIKICSVTRLVNYKKYIFAMIDTVKNLVKDGIDAYYDIYGYGPLYESIRNKIIDLKLEERVKLCGNIEYENLYRTFKNYDLFFGGGTAIIEASSAGLISITAIESFSESYCYGYFSDLAKTSYNSKELNHPKLDLLKFIKDYSKKTNFEKNELVKKHKNCVYIFTMSECNNNFEDKGLTTNNNFFYSKIRYSFSRAKNIFLRKFFPKFKNFKEYNY